MRLGKIPQRFLAVAGSLALCMVPAFAQHGGGASHGGMGRGGGHASAPAPSFSGPSVPHFAAASHSSTAPPAMRPALPFQQQQKLMAPPHIVTIYPPGSSVSPRPPATGNQFRGGSFPAPVGSRAPVAPGATNQPTLPHTQVPPSSGKVSTLPGGTATPAISNPRTLPQRPIYIYPGYYGYPPYFYGFSPFFGFGYGYCGWGFSPFDCYSLYGGSPWGSPFYGPYGYNGFGYSGYGYGIGYSSSYGSGYSGGMNSSISDSSGTYGSNSYPGATSDGASTNSSNTSSVYAAPSTQDSAGAAAQGAPASTILFFTDGTSAEVTNYWVAQDELHFTTVGGGSSFVALAQLDVNRTVQENQSRGVNITLQTPTQPETPASQQPQPPPQP